MKYFRNISSILRCYVGIHLAQDSNLKKKCKSSLCAFFSLFLEYMHLWKSTLIKFWFPNSVSFKVQHFAWSIFRKIEKLTFIARNLLKVVARSGDKETQGLNEDFVRSVKKISGRDKVQSECMWETWKQIGSDMSDWWGKDARLAQCLSTYNMCQVGRSYVGRDRLVEWWLRK